MNDDNDKFKQQDAVEEQPAVEEIAEEQPVEEQPAEEQSSTELTVYGLVAGVVGYITGYSDE